jgi:outer membrane autotransporter barrel domain/autotransporter-associated beta strand repeat
VLEGDNAYTGGTRVLAGTLVGSAGAIAGDLHNGGTVVFDQEDDAVFAGAIAGLGGTGGGMVKRGAGLLELAGHSTLAWTVEAGTLAASAQRFTGDLAIAGGAGFRFDQEADGTYAGTLSGDGALRKQGAGGLTLAGDSSGFTGTTTVSAGTLRVDGLLGGRVTVEDGATLGGAGTVGDTTVKAGATLAPGNSIGSLRIDGDLVFQAGARYEVEVDPAGTGSDLVEVTGTASLQGGSVVHIGANDGYRLRSTYRILSAGSLQGTFDEVSSDFAFLAPELAYDHQAGTVDLTLVRNDRDFASVALTRNQKATAAGIESIGLEAGHAVHDAIAQMPDDAALIRAGFDALSGEAHASARALLLDDAGWLADAVTRRHAGAAATGELTPATTLWLDAGGGQARTGSDGNGARWQGNAHGLAVGADVEVGPGRIGLAAGKRRTNQQVSDRSSRNRIDSRHLALHAAATLGPVQLAGGVARGRYTLELDRRVALAEIDETLASSSDAEADVLFLEASLAEPARGVAPWLGIRQVRLDSDPARESGGSAALSVAGGRHDLGSATLGVLADRRLGDGSRLQARLGWRHAWGDLTPWATVAFDAGDAFTVYAPAMARNSLVYALDLGLATGPRSRLALGMAGQAGDGSRAWGAQLQWQATF